MRRAPFLLVVLLAACGSRTGLEVAPPPDVTPVADLGPEVGPDVAADAPADDGPAPRPDVVVAQPNVTCEAATPLPPGVDVDLVVDTAGARDRVSACEVPVVRGGPVRYYRLTLLPMQEVSFTSDYVIPLPYARIYPDCARAQCLAQTRVGGRGAFASYRNFGSTTELIVALGFDYGTVAEVPSGTLRMRVTYDGGVDPASCRTATALTRDEVVTLPTATIAAETGCTPSGPRARGPFAIGSARVPAGRVLSARVADGSRSPRVHLVLSCTPTCLRTGFGSAAWQNPSSGTATVDILVNDEADPAAASHALTFTLQ